MPVAVITYGNMHAYKWFLIFWSFQAIMNFFGSIPVFLFLLVLLVALVIIIKILELERWLKEKKKLFVLHEWKGEYLCH